MHRFARTSLSRRAATTALWGTTVTSHRHSSLFTNKKRPAPGMEEEPSFLRGKPQEGDPMLSAHQIEQRLPSKQQLQDELPSAAEVERAIREGKIDQYIVEEPKDE